MATTKINTGKVIDASAKASSAHSTTANVGIAVSSIRRRIDGSILARNGVAGSFTTAQNTISELARDIAKIYQMANGAAGQYESTETSILNEGKRIGLIVDVANTSGQTSENKALYESLFDEKELHLIKSGMSVEEYLEEIGQKPEETTDGNEEASKEGSSGLGEAFFDAIGKMGILGATADGIADMVNGFDDPKNKSDMYKALLGGADKFVESFGDLAENAFKKADDVDLKSVLVGNWNEGSLMDEFGDVVNASGWKDKFFEQIKGDVADFSVKNADTVGDKIKVGTKWAGTAISFVSSAIDNQDEYREGKITKERAVAETITETAVDLAIDAAATAGAAIATSALLGAAAPAVVVGVAAVGITWAADSVTKFVTKKMSGEEKDLKEVTSDFILDIGEGAINIGKNFVDNISVNWEACFG